MKKLTIALAIAGALLGARWLLSDDEAQDAPGAALIFDREHDWLHSAKLRPVALRGPLQADDEPTAWIDEA